MASSEEEYNSEDEKRRENKFLEKKKNYAHKYPSTWEEHDCFRAWLKPRKLGNKHLYCEFCSSDYKVIKHSKAFEKCSNL